MFVARERDSRSQLVKYARTDKKSQIGPKKLEHDNLGTPRTNKRALVSKYLIQPMHPEFNSGCNRLFGKFQKLDIYQVFDVPRLDILGWILEIHFLTILISPWHQIHKWTDRNRTQVLTVQTADFYSQTVIINQTFCSVIWPILGVFILKSYFPVPQTRAFCIA